MDRRLNKIKENFLNETY